MVIRETIETPGEYKELQSKQQSVDSCSGTRVVYTKEPKRAYPINTGLLAKHINPTKFTSTINTLEIKDDDGNTHTYSLIDILDGLTIIAKKVKE